MKNVDLYIKNVSVCVIHVISLKWCTLIAMINIVIPHTLHTYSSCNAWICSAFNIRSYSSSISNYDETWTPSFLFGQTALVRSSSLLGHSPPFPPTSLLGHTPLFPPSFLVCPLSFHPFAFVMTKHSSKWHLKKKNGCQQTSQGISQLLSFTISLPNAVPYCTHTRQLHHTRKITEQVI